MWVTQTYLGAVEPDAKVFVYYFFEDYNREQTHFTNEVQRELEKLGEVFGDKVSLLMPNPRYAGRIESEVRENMELWQQLRDKLPGLFVSTTPLKSLERISGSDFFLSFDTQNHEQVAEVIFQVRRIAGDYLNWDFKQKANKSNENSFWKKIMEAIELKPGIAGIRIDVKKLGGW